MTELDTKERQDRLSSAATRVRAAKRALHDRDPKKAIKRIASAIDGLSSVLDEIEDATGLEAGSIE